MSDCYQLLGVSPSADASEIRRAWLRLVKQCHPDCAPHPDTGRFRAITAAYETLSDPMRRARYDQERLLGRGTSAMEPGGLGVDLVNAVRELFRQMGTMPQSGQQWEVNLPHLRMTLRLKRD